MTKETHDLAALVARCDGTQLLDKPAFDDALAESGYSLLQFADLTGVCRTTTFRHREHLSHPPAETLAAYGKVLGVDPLTLVKKSDAELELEQLRAQLAEARS